MIRSPDAAQRNPARSPRVVVFMLTRRSIFAGVIAGEVVMLGRKTWLG
ncbi:hypothetical protein [Bradyrhizobium semiaridum]|nr:hypothetical protein [Bradyrhizobium semiaridum]